MKKLKEIINACWLCLKYPFLYPRNRFSDRHTVSLLHKPLYKLYEKSIQEISITGKLEKEGKHYLPFADFFDYRVKLNKENTKLIITKGKQTIEHDITSLLWKADKFEVLGLNLTFALTGSPIVRVCVKTKDETDTTNYGFRYENVKLFKSKTLYRVYKVLKWIDKEILDRICFIPTYTELDAMPDGWRKAFGIQMCEEIKQALLDAGGRKLLKSYRIAQIKEKFGCYDEETEVLTLSGWKYFKDVTLEDKVASLNNGELTYVNPSDKIEYYYEGKMYKLYNRGIDLLVTPNHNLYISKGSYVNGKTNEKIKYDMEFVHPDKYFRKDKRFLKGCKWVGTEIPNTFKIPDYTFVNNAKSKAGRIYKRSYTLIGPTFNTDAFLAFLGFYVAEGYTEHGNGNGSQISIAYNPYDEEELVKTLISNIGFKPTNSGRGLKRIHNAPLAVWLKENCGHLAPNKKVPNFIKTLTPDKIELFLKYLFIGDGHQTATANILTTTSKQLCDDVCELLLKAGYAFSYYITQPTISERIRGKYIAYNINWLKNVEIEVDMSKAVKSKSYIEDWVDYSGKVYCLTVPNHLLYVRRNGKGVWCGNSICWYDDGAPQKVYREIVPKYENLSQHTCINCGKPAEYISKGWISPYCGDCAKDKTRYVKITEEDAWSEALGSY